MARATCILTGGSFRSYSSPKGCSARPRAGAWWIGIRQHRHADHRRNDSGQINRLIEGDRSKEKYHADPARHSDHAAQPDTLAPADFGILSLSRRNSSADVELGPDVSAIVLRGLASIESFPLPAPGIRPGRHGHQ